MAEFYDISFNFDLDSTGDIALVEDNEAINQSIRNILLSPTGSKPGVGPINTIFGVGVKLYLFAPLSEFVARSLGGNIYRQLVMLETRIEVRNVNVAVNKTDRLFDVNVDYVIAKTDQQFNYRTAINQL